MAVPRVAFRPCSERSDEWRRVWPAAVSRQVIPPPAAAVSPLLWAAGQLRNILPAGLTDRLQLNPRALLSTALASEAIIGEPLSFFWMTPAPPGCRPSI
jgi:hypothetical protein